MKNKSNNGLIGAVLIGIGCGLTAAGVALLVPACANWSLGWLGEGIRRSREGVEGAAASLGQFAGRTRHQFQHHFGEAAKTARGATSKAAGAVESAARQVRERTS